MLTVNVKSVTRKGRMKYLFPLFLIASARADVLEDVTEGLNDDDTPLHLVFQARKNVRLNVSSFSGSKVVKY